MTNYTKLFTEPDFLLFFKGLKAPKYFKDRGLDNGGHFRPCYFKGNIAYNVEQNMKKGVGLGFLTLINCSVLYLIYWYMNVVCSTKIDNILHIPYEPSGMQLYYYFLSFPLFLFLALLSTLHSSYFNLKKSLSLGIIIIWFCYLVLILYVDLIVHYSTEGGNLLYYGSLSISFVAVCYIIYSTYRQIMQLTIYGNDN